ncbi:hydrogenase 4 subunit F [Ferrimonas lipolytica]|uniref:Hydrogenase 4 subunit F n=1 Tax=Ferrimonas lipolytica TaxID=2724191 RepID=A0A6H1UDE7_9GAMM|nr:hydrogenase 4 subunit F [Ferrimonas lipolytica]QIZ76236.1 hydrogenase 4 subunit F [Ferrimonas lipolytica]
MELNVLLPLLLGLPIVAALVGFGSLLLGAAGRPITIAAHLVSMVGVFVLSMMAAGSVISDGPALLFGNWFYLDGLTALFIGVLGLVALTTGLYSIGYINHEFNHGEITMRQHQLYYALFNMFVATMLLSLVSNNVIMMWVAIEATTVCSVFLVGLYGQRSSLEAAWKYLVICNVGLAFGLFGAIISYANGAATLPDPANAIFWTELRQYANLLDPALVHLAFIFVMIGFGTKVGLFPMHAWLPDAHSEAPSPVSALLSAGLLNCAFMVILRYYVITTESIGSTFPQMMMLGFGFMSVLVSSFFIIIQHDIKRKLAYHSVEHMGLIAMAIGLGPIGALAGLMHVINHSLAKTLMFCGAGNILLKYGSRDTGVVRGLLKAAPMTAVMVACGALALGGVPPFSIFITEFMMVTAAVDVDKTWFAVVLLLVLSMVLAALAHMVAGLVMGEKPTAVAKGDVSLMSIAPMCLLLVLLVVMGTRIPDGVLNTVDQAALVVLNSDETTTLNTLNLPEPIQRVIQTDAPVSTLVQNK